MNNTPRKRDQRRVVSKAPSKSDARHEKSMTPLERPNVDDPLSEPTRHRRLWAAYLQRGLTRREFAEKIGTNYHTVNRWDAGAAAISLEMLERASKLVRYSMDELCFGKRAPVALAAANGTVRPVLESPISPLKDADIRSLMDRLRVDPLTRRAFGRHTSSDDGKFQTFTGDYVIAWCAAYAETRNEDEAIEAAVKAQAVGEVVAHGARYVSPESLREAAQQYDESEV